MQTLLDIRESDLQSLQDALNGLEAASRRQGESHTNDRFALELELDRLKRDFARCEQDLARARDEVEEKKAKAEEQEMAMAKLVSSVSCGIKRGLTLACGAAFGEQGPRDSACGADSDSTRLDRQIRCRRQGLSFTLVQWTTRLELTKKAWPLQNLRDTQDELSAARDRLRVVEDQLNTDHRALSRTENQYRDQLTERNTLLLTIYQYMDKMVGSSPVRALSSRFLASTYC